MAELLGIFGKMSKELFEYNRDVFKFDQMQRLQRDILKLEMQVKRFQLFREDIRDLVELTVSKMEMYHLVGALFLEFCVAFYVEGKIEALEVPCFSISLYYLSVAGAYLYLVLAVWLSMHASISSHSFGVRLLCRYVRLPIPGAQQLSTMNTRLEEFESEYKTGMMRVPFLQKAQNWKSKQELGTVPEQGPSSSSSRGSGVQRPIGGERSADPDYLGSGETPFAGGEEGILRACRRGLAGEHVRLFRKLQAKWQCFDAYARVSMSLGANQILLSITYYMINVTMVEYRSPTACLALIIVFQAAALALALLDISALSRCWVVATQCLGTLPCFIAAASLMWPAGRPVDYSAAVPFEPAKYKYPSSPLCFFLMVAWLECLMWVAWPTADEASLPLRFRQVLFLDVFGDLSSDPTDAEVEPMEGRPAPRPTSSGEEAPPPPLERVSAAEDCCELAHQALRRWETVPEAFNVANLQRDLKKFREELTVWRNALDDEVKFHAARTGTRWSELIASSTDRRGYYELSQEEFAEDNFGGRLVGPLQLTEANGKVTSYFWDADEQRMVLSSSGRPTLSLQEVAGLLVDCETKVRSVLSPRHLSSAEARLLGASTSDSDEAGFESDGAPGFFPQLVRSTSASSGKFFAVMRDSPTVPQRLPWKVLKLSTRALQAAWFFQGSVFACEELEYFKIDFVRVERAESEGPPQRQEGERRSLGATAPTWSFQEAPLLLGAPVMLAASASLACSPGFRHAFPPAPLVVEPAPGNDTSAWSQLFLRGTAAGFALGDAGAGGLGSRPRRWRPWSEAEAALLSAPSALVCAGAGADGAERFKPTEDHMCIVATPRSGGVEFRTWRGVGGEMPVLLPIEDSGRTGLWRLMSGSLLPCDRVASLLSSLPPLVHEAVPSWCSLLAGWDGLELVVAAVRLSAGPGSLPDVTEAIVPMYSLPLPSPSEADDVRAVSVTAFGRLAVLLRGEVLAAWSLLPRPQLLHRWQLGPLWPLAAGAAPWAQEGRAFRATGLCLEEIGETAARVRLLAAGHDLAGRPRLIAAEASLGS